MVNEFIYRLNNKGISPSGTRATPQNALGMPLCSHALKHVCNQSNGMAEHQGRGDIETRELKSESGTCNVSFCVFSKCYVWNVSVLFTVVCLSVTITSIWWVTDSNLDRVFFSARAKLYGCECTRSLCCLFGSGACTVSSRGSWLCIVLPQTSYFEECVRFCGLCECCPAVALLTSCFWDTTVKGFTFKSNSPSLGSVLQLYSSDEVDVVSFIVEEIEYTPSQSFEKHTAF